MSKGFFRIAIYSFDMSEGSGFPRFDADVLSQVFRANEWASVLGLVSSAGAKAHSQAAEDDPMFDIAGDLLPTDFADSGSDSMETDSIPDSGMTSEYLYTSPESSEAISTETDSISSDGMTSEYHYTSSESAETITPQRKKVSRTVGVISLCRNGREMTLDGIPPSPKGSDSSFRHCESAEVCRMQFRAAKGGRMCPGRCEITLPALRNARKWLFVRLRAFRAREYHSGVFAIRRKHSVHPTCDSGNVEWVFRTSECRFHLSECEFRSANRA